MKRSGPYDELIDAVQAAQILGLRQRNSVSTYLHRYADFPPPMVDRGPRKARLWRRRDIISWHDSRLAGRRR
jgi:hypothetical protein